MSVLDWQAEQIELAAERLAHFVRTTRDDWLEREPAVDEKSRARSIKEQVEECARSNRRATALLRGDPEPEPLPGCADTKASLELLDKSAREFARVVRESDESVLDRVFQFGAQQWPGKRLIVTVTWNMVYHAGQVNYIQLLYGDAEFHRPPR